MNSAALFGLFAGLLLFSFTYVRLLACLQKRDRKHLLFSILYVCLAAAFLTMTYPVLRHTIEYDGITIIDNPRVQGFVDHTASWFTEGISRISVRDFSLSLAMTNIVKPDGFESIAYYNPWTNEIMFKSDAVTYFNFMHEVAHHIWFTHLTEAERQLWIAEREQDPYRPTAYAATKAEEDFADSFAMYFCGLEYELNPWRSQFIAGVLPPDLQSRI